MTTTTTAPATLIATLVEHRDILADGWTHTIREATAEAERADDDRARDMQTRRAESAVTDCEACLAHWDEAITDLESGDYEGALLSLELARQIMGHWGDDSVERRIIESVEDAKVYATGRLVCPVSGVEYDPVGMGPVVWAFRGSPARDLDGEILSDDVVQAADYIHGGAPVDLFDGNVLGWTWDASSEHWSPVRFVPTEAATAALREGR